MVEFEVAIKLNADYFREANKGQGMTKTELHKELKRHIKDELNEYNWHQILDAMIETHPVLNVPCVPLVIRVQRG